MSPSSDPRHHDHDHHHGHRHPHDDADLANLLDLDAEVLGSWLEDVTDWLTPHAPAAPRRILDLGAGTGAGSLALARRFRSAEVVAVDRSATMLDRVRAAATREGLADRVRPVEADLDAARPDVDDVDLAWASSSLHEVGDPDRLLRDVHGVLRPGGVLVVAEMDALPRFLPDEVGFGRPGLEERCQEAAARAGWNAYPDWSAHLERAGFEVLERRTFATAGPVPSAGRGPSAAGRYAQAHLRKIRAGLAGRIDDDDLATLDRLLADGPDGVLHRPDLTVRGGRTVWVARRP